MIHKTLFQPQSINRVQVLAFLNEGGIAQVDASVF